MSFSFIFWINDIQPITEDVCKYAIKLFHDFSVESSNLDFV